MKRRIIICPVATIKQTLEHLKKKPIGSEGYSIHLCGGQIARKFSDALIKAYPNFSECKEDPTFDLGSGINGRQLLAQILKDESPIIVVIVESERCKSIVSAIEHRYNQVHVYADDSVADFELTLHDLQPNPASEYERESESMSA